MRIAVLPVLLGIGVIEAGCPGSGIDPSLSPCCTDFKVGADLTGADFGVDASLQGQFTAFAQAASDISAVATASLDDVTSACKAIATAGGANGDQEDGIESQAPKDRVGAWCTLAKERIDAKLAGSLTVTAEAPQCQASVKATASCQANCTVDASCKAQVKAQPPKCSGTMEYECSGDCTLNGQAEIDCQGSCQADCHGSCTAQGGVECAGKCDGQCSVATDAGGNCNGTCNGTCSATPPGVVCTGTCNGTCTGTCTGTADVKARCSGTCDGGVAVACKGGKLEASASCDVDANCQANCNASVQAKAECTPPRVDVVFSGDADAEVSALIDALRLNLPNIFLVFKTRGEAFVKTAVEVGGNASAIFDPGKMGLKGTACLAAIVPVLVQAGDNASAAFEASASIVASTGGG